MKKICMFIIYIFLFNACSNKIEYNELVENNYYTIGNKEKAINVLTFKQINQNKKEIINIDFYIDKYPYNKNFNLCNNTKCISSIYIKEIPKNSNIIGETDLNFKIGFNDNTKDYNYASFSSNIILGYSTIKNFNDTNIYTTTSWTLK